MAKDRPPTAFLVMFALAVVVLVGFLGTMAFQALSADEGERPGTFVEQVRALPFVEDVETRSDRIVGTTSRTMESRLTLSPEVTDDPAAAAAGLAGVTWGYDRSHWSIEGVPSTAYVTCRSPVDDAPIRWWTEAVAALEDADPDAALHCRITDAALSCEVETDDPGGARRALAGVDGSAVQPWLDAARPDQGEQHGFWLRVGEETVTDPRSTG